MKKFMTFVAVVLCVVMGMSFLTGCAGEKNIAVLSREDGSGTRDAFDSLIKNAEGEDLGDAGMVATVEKLNTTGNVMTKVASTKTAMGYISLGSLNDTVKAVNVGGVAPTSANVLSGDYKLSRNFYIATNKSVTMQAAAADFMKFLASKEAQEIVKADYVQIAANTTSYTKLTAPISGTIVLRGSTSVDPLMDDLIGEYKKINGTNVSSVVFDKEATGSSAGKTAAKNDTVGNVIGMSSSSVSAADQVKVNVMSLATDAIAVVVHKENELSNITIEQIFDVYTGAITKFSEIK